MLSISCSSIRCCTISTIPARALREARGRACRRAGGSLVVDFAPHGLEFLREEHAHRRLGFAHDQLAGWLEEAGLDLVTQRDLSRGAKDKDALTVSLWLARDRRTMTDWPLQDAREVA